MSEDERKKDESRLVFFGSESNIFRVCVVYVGWLCGFYYPIEVCRDAGVGKNRFVLLYVKI